MSTAADLLDTMAKARDQLRAAEREEAEARKVLRAAQEKLKAANKRYSAAIDEALDEKKKPGLPFDEAAAETKAALQVAVAETKPAPAIIASGPVAVEAPTKGEPIEPLGLTAAELDKAVCPGKIGRAGDKPKSLPVVTVNGRPHVVVAGAYPAASSGRPTEWKIRPIWTEKEFPSRYAGELSESVQRSDIYLGVKVLVGKGKAAIIHVVGPKHEERKLIEFAGVKEKTPPAPPVLQTLWRDRPVHRAKWLDDELNVRTFERHASWLAGLGVRTFGQLADRLLAGDTFDLSKTSVENLQDAIVHLSAGDATPIKFRAAAKKVAAPLPDKLTAHLDKVIENFAAGTKELEAAIAAVEGPAKPKHITVADDVAAVLSDAVADGNVLRLAGGRIERGLYGRVNKVLEQLGGKWDKKKQAHVFPEPAAPLLTRALAGGKVLDKKQSYQFFETPRPLAARMVDLANIVPGMTVLEPSAGKGAIADAVRAVCIGARITCVELDPENVTALAAKSYEVAGVNFLKWGKVGDSILTFDRVVMNPPFTGGQDIEHVLHALDLLKPGGRLVSVVSWTATEGAAKRPTDFRSLLDELDAEVHDLEPGTFSVSGTKASAKLVVIDKPRLIEPAPAKKSLLVEAAKGSGFTPEQVASVDPAELATAFNPKLPERKPVVLLSDVPNLPDAVFDALFVKGISSLETLTEWVNESTKGIDLPLRNRLVTFLVNQGIRLKPAEHAADAIAAHVAKGYQKTVTCPPAALMGGHNPPQSCVQKPPKKRKAVAQ